MDKSPQNPSTSAFSLVFAHMNLNGRLSAAVESDIVGYTTTSLPRGFFALAVPFSSLEETKEGYPIAQLSGNLYANDNVARADYLLVQDPDTKAYTTYYYKTQGWTKEGEDTVTTDVIASDKEFFFIRIVKRAQFLRQEKSFRSHLRV